MPRTPLARIAPLAALLALVAAPRLGAQNGTPIAGAPPIDAIAPADSARPKTIERFLQVTNSEQLYKASIDASLAAQIKQNPQLAAFNDVMHAFVDKYVSYAIVKPDLVRIYRETFSEADLEQAIQLYQTPFGQRMLSKMPVVMARGQEMGAEHMRAHLPELVQMIQERVQQQQTGKPTPSGGER